MTAAPTLQTSAATRSRHCCVLSVVICTYNNADVLDRALDALGRQERADGLAWDVTIIDNNCTDHTAAVVAKWRDDGRLPQLRRVVETRQGLTPARQRGAMETSGDWLAFVDDDCLVAPDWVEQVGAAIERRREAAAIGGRVLLLWEAEPPAFVHQFAYCLAEQNLGDDARQSEALVGAGVIINRKRLVASGWCDRPLMSDRIGRRLISGGDVELTLRLADVATLWYEPSILIHHLIPARRTAPIYLLRLNYALGQSQQKADAMRHRGGLLTWIRTAGGAPVAQVRWAFHLLRTRAGVKDRLVSTAMPLCFAAGQWVGLMRLLLMRLAARRQLMGLLGRRS